jgi:hypothetical protein
MMPDAPTVRSQMPCCDAETSIAPRDTVVSLQPTTFAGFSSPQPQMWAPVALVVRTGAAVLPSRVLATLATVSSAHPEPFPPIFLLNAQFLI